MTDISVGAGGAPFNSETDDRYLARLFAMRYTDNSRLSLYANANNVKREPCSHAPRWLQGFSVATDITCCTCRKIGVKITCPHDSFSQALEIPLQSGLQTIIVRFSFYIYIHS